jgi:hypothetical protein
MVVPAMAGHGGRLRGAVRRAHAVRRHQVEVEDQEHRDRAKHPFHRPNTNAVPFAARRPLTPPSFDRHPRNAGTPQRTPCNAACRARRILWRTSHRCRHTVYRVASRTDCVERWRRRRADRLPRIRCSMPGRRWSSPCRSCVRSSVRIQSRNRYRRRCSPWPSGRNGRSSVGSPRESVLPRDQLRSSRRGGPH